MKTIISNDVEHASTVLKKGGILVFPSETVWGIGADSRNHNACKKIYEIKKRPLDNPFIIHTHSMESLEILAELDPKYKSLLNKFSPGPISYILKKKDPSLFSTGLETIGVRIPKHPDFLSILEYSNIPISAPSANFSGKPSITKFNDAVENFDSLVDFIFQGETSEIGLESTVLNLFDSEKILRPGKITFEELRVFLPNLKEEFSSKEIILSPGTKYRHYSPNCDVELFSKFTQLKRPFSYIGNENIADADFSVHVQNNEEYMKELYSFFIESDKRKIKIAYCESPFENQYKKVLLNRIEKAIQK